MEEKNPTIEIIVPCYNEGEGLVRFFETIEEVFKREPIDWKVCFVNDGSTDNTFDVLEMLKREKGSKVKLVSLFSNVGHQAAVCAGIQHFSSDVGIIMDADLEHPPSLIPKMLDL